VYRYNPSASPDGLAGSEGTFSLCTFWYVDALARAGRLDDAQLVFQKMQTYANHLGLFSEEIGLTGEQLGNFPQAFSHLSLINAAINLDYQLDHGAGDVGPVLARARRMSRSATYLSAWRWVHGRTRVRAGLTWAAAGPRARVPRFSAGDDNRARAAEPRPEAEDNMADTTMPTDAERAAARHYLLRFEVDTLRSRPLWIRLIIEFLGTFVLVTVAAGAGVINHYAGGNPVSRTAAV